jgi:hypothetical protein
MKRKIMIKILLAYLVIYLSFSLSILLYLNNKEVDFRLDRKYNLIPKFKFQNLLKFGKTGDLIFLSGKTGGENLIRAYTDSIFSHIGVLIKDKDKLYLWETGIGQGYIDAARIIPLKDKLTSNYKTVVGWKKINKSINNTSLFSVIKFYIKTPSDTIMCSWLNENLKIKKSLFCSELTALTLQKLGILNQTRPACYYTPEEFNRGVLLLKDYKYLATKFCFYKN